MDFVIFFTMPDLPEKFSGVALDGSRVPFEPIRDVHTLYESLDERVMAGFGGVCAIRKHHSMKKEA